MDLFMFKYCAISATIFFFLAMVATFVHMFTDTNEKLKKIHEYSVNVAFVFISFFLAFFLASGTILFWEFVL